MKVEVIDDPEDVVDGIATRGPIEPRFGKTL
jgi:hypothetical protein